MKKTLRKPKKQVFGKVSLYRNEYNQGVLFADGCCR